MVAAVARSFRARLLLLFALGLGVRVAFVALEPATSPVADETMWLTWGTEVLPSPEVGFSPERLRFVFHPPLYLYFIGVVQAVFGSLEAVKHAHAQLIATIEESLTIADEGKKKRVEAEKELVGLESSLKQALQQASARAQAQIPAGGMASIPKS